MARVTKLSDAEVTERLGSLDGWSVVDGKLHREFKFADFREAFAFMTTMALTAEKLDHHPEWFNVYSTVRVDLTTHDVSGISDLDFQFATAADKAAS